MANRRIVDGKTTKQRLDQELQRLKDTNESVTLADFARRARVSYAALTHQYKTIADEVRRLRDGTKPASGRSPATLPRKRHPDLAEATTLIEKLRHQISDLTRDVSRLRAERDQWQRQAHHLETVQDQNERLRGVVAALADGLTCEADQRMMHRLLDDLNVSDGA